MCVLCFVRFLQIKMTISKNKALRKAGLVSVLSSCFFSLIQLCLCETFEEGNRPLLFIRGGDAEARKAFSVDFKSALKIFFILVFGKSPARFRDSRAARERHIAEAVEVCDILRPGGSFNTRYVLSAFVFESFDIGVEIVCLFKRSYGIVVVRIICEEIGDNYPAAFVRVIRGFQCVNLMFL